MKKNKLALKIIAAILIVINILPLSGCLQDTNPPSTRHLLQKPLVFQSDKYLYKNYIGLFSNRTGGLQIVGDKADVDSLIARGWKIYIIGIIKAGTKYHYEEIRLAQRMSDMSSEYYIRIDSGPYANTRALDETFLHPR